MITYAQNFEDVMLARVFDGRRNGFYIDVGAGDPAYFSVTKWFYDLGWSGINIEPNNSLYQRLLTERPRDINLAVGAGAAFGEATFREFGVRELSSFDPRIHEKAASAGIPSETRTVPVFTLNSIIAKHCAGRQIDFLKIDVEGWEREVLTGFDLHQHRPTVLVIEATLPTTRINSHSEWEDILTRSDFSCVYFDGLNRFYLAEENIHLKEHFELPPNVFDEITSVQLVEADAEIRRLRALNSAQEAEINRLKEICCAENANPVALNEAKASSDAQVQHFTAPELKKKTGPD
jgi:FkbM family methyltransferase